jgi:hypothetical protein
LRGCIDAELFEGIDDLLLGRIVCDPGSSAFAAAKTPVEVFAKTHSSTGCSDDGNLRPKLGRPAQNFIQRVHQHVRGAMEAAIASIRPRAEQDRIRDLPSGLAARFFYRESLDW